MLIKKNKQILTADRTHTHTHTSIHIYTGVPGGMCQTSGECSLC